MKKLAAVSVLLSLSLSLVVSASGQTRPRRAPEATPPPSTTSQQNNQQYEVYDPNQPSQAQRSAPVLKTSDGRPVTGTPANPAANSGAGGQTAVPDGPQEVDENEVIRVDTALITLPVSVTDRDGKYIGNLRQKDFRIYEDGVEQDVAYFAPVEKPFTVALLLDMSGSTKDHLREIQDAAFTFVEQLRRDDKVMIISFDDDVHVLAEPTSDHRVLRNAINSAHSGDGTSLYEAVDFVLNQRFNRIDGRKAIVLFTDGVDTTSRRASYQSNVLDAEEDGALVYVMQYDTFSDRNGGMGRPPYNPNSSPSPTPQQGTKRPTLIDIIVGMINDDDKNPQGRHRRNSGGGATESDYQRADSYLHAIADRTGARVERADSIANMERSFANIADELRLQYSLGYYPKTASAPGQRHAVRVRVMRPNLAVKARNSYITGEPTGPKTNPTKFAGSGGFRAGQ